MEKFITGCFLFLFLSSSNLYSLNLSDSSYYPMTLGNEWEFYSDFDPHSEKIVDTLKINNKLYYGFALFATTPEYWLREHNNQVYYLNTSDSTEFLLFDFTLDIGDSIEFPLVYDCSFGRKIFLVRKSDTIIPPADTFYNCYHFEHQIPCFDAGILDTWFSRGIGKVKYVAVYWAGIKEFLLNNYSIITSMDAKYDDKMVSSYKLFQNYPNPFNPSTIISWQSPIDSWQTLKIFDVLGNEVSILVDEFKPAGSYEVEYQSTVGSHQLTSGIYFYQLRIGDLSETKKMILIR